MAIEHARLCGACEKDFPGWADRCPRCGNGTVLRRIVILPRDTLERETTVTVTARPRGKQRSARTAAKATRAATS